MAEGGGPQALTSLQLVPFRDVLENLLQEAHSDLQQLADKLPALGDEERKRQLLQHLQTTRQRLQRLHVCAQWAHKAKAVNTCREVLKAAQDHCAAFVHTADEFFRLHDEMRFTRAPLFDVSTALHIMQTGNYRLLPAIIESELVQPGQQLQRPGELGEVAAAEASKAALRRVDFLLRSKLLTTVLPAGMRVQRVRGGRAAVSAAGGQYSALLTLVPAPRDDVTLSKYRPPGEAEEVTAGAAGAAGTAAAPKQEQEVVQPVGSAGGATQAADDQPSTSAAAAAAAAPKAAGSGDPQNRQGTDCWRWQLLSFELLPAAAGADPPPLLPQQRQWLQQHIEQRMWAAADVAQLVALGKQAWVTVPALPSAAKEQQQQQEGAGRALSGLQTSGPAPSSSLASPAAAAAADSKGKQPLVKEEAVKGEEEAAAAAAAEGQQDAAGAAGGSGFPATATSPLAAMHAILCQTAGRLALFSLLLSDARQLEGGSWKGCLKLSRAAGGRGIRLAYWPQLPCASYAELQCLREGMPFQPSAAAAAAGAGAGAAAPDTAAAPALTAAAGAAAAPAPGAAAGVAAAAAGREQQAPAVEVVLQQDGCLAVASSPQLRHPLSGDPVPLSLPLDSTASFDASRLLLQAAAATAAVQLAAVQAVLQRGGRLAPAGIHAELVVLGASSAASASSAPPPSPLLQLWCGGSLQLSLSMQLRTGRLLLAASPELLEREQGGRAAAAVAAAQQQVDQAQREAMTQPLPAGTSRGMHAASMLADALTRLSLQLAMDAQQDAAAAVALACGGLRRATLPKRLLQQYFEQAAGAVLLRPLSPNVLTLAIPAFPPPSDMQRWARQHQRPGAGGAGGGASGSGGAGRPASSSSSIDSGATRCFMLLDFGKLGGGVGAGGGAGDAAAQQQQGEQQQQEQLDQQQEQQQRMLLAVCSCTSRGTVSRVLHVFELPPQLLLGTQQGAAGAGTAAAATAPSRKRRADSDSDEPPAAAAATAAAAAGGARWDADLAPAAAWCRRQASWEALRSQLQLLPVQHAEELELGGRRQRAIRLPKLPTLVQLDTWAAAQLAAAAGGAGTQQAQQAIKPSSVLQLDDNDAESAGSWRVQLSSLYFASLRTLLQRQGIQLATGGGSSIGSGDADMAHVQITDTGLTMHYSLQKGHSVLTAVTDLARLGMLHLSLTRLAGCMAANPLAAGAKALAGDAPAPATAGNGNGSLAQHGFLDGPLAGAGAGAGLGGSNGQLLPANGQLIAGGGDGGGSHGGKPVGGLVWPLPGCGLVRLQSAGLSYFQLLVAPPPQLPSSQQQQQKQPPPMLVTVHWVSTLSDAPAQAAPVTTAAAAQQRAGSPAPGSSTAGASNGAAGSGSGGPSGGSSSGSSGGGSLRHVRCRVRCEPPVPEPVAAALAQQIEAGRSDLFLDSLCLAAHSAAAAAQQLTPQAQRAAGLLPGALKVQAGSPCGSSALRLRAHLQQGNRAAVLALSFQAAGFTLLQMQPALSHAAGASSTLWMPALWQHLQQQVPTFAPVDTSDKPAGVAAAAPGDSQAQKQQQQRPQQMRQAWVQREGLGQALAAIMRAVAAVEAS